MPTTQVELTQTEAQRAITRVAIALRDLLHPRRRRRSTWVAL